MVHWWKTGWTKLRNTVTAGCDPPDTALPQVTGGLVHGVRWCDLNFVRGSAYDVFAHHAPNRGLALAKFSRVQTRVRFWVQTA